MNNRLFATLVAATLASSSMASPDNTTQKLLATPPSMLEWGIELVRRNISDTGRRMPKFSLENEQHQWQFNYWPDEDNFVVHVFPEFSSGDRYPSLEAAKQYCQETISSIRQIAGVDPVSGELGGYNNPTVNDFPFSQWSRLFDPNLIVYGIGGVDQKLAKKIDAKFHILVRALFVPNESEKDLYGTYGCRTTLIGNSNFQEWKN